MPQQKIIAIKCKEKRKHSCDFECPCPVKVKKVEFGAFNSVVTPVAANTTITVPFPTEEYDRVNKGAGTTYDPLTSVFTAPAGGVYHFDVTFTILATGIVAAGPVVVGLSKNNAAPIIVQNFTVIPASPQTVPVQLSGNILLNATETVRVTLANGPTQIQILGAPSFAHFNGNLE